MRVTISLKESLLQEIDTKALSLGISRSAFIVMTLTTALNQKRNDYIECLIEEDKRSKKK